MNALQSVKKWLSRATVWFTVLALVTLLFGLLFLPEQDHVNAISFLFLFPFSLCASAAGLLWKQKTLAAVWRFLLHYLILLASLFLFVILPAGVNLSVPFWIFMLLLFTVLWWISRGVVHILETKLSGEK